MKHNLFKDKDVIFSTIFVFAFIGLLKFSIVHIPHLDPINQAFEDVELSDVVYQYMRDKNDGTVNSPVVIASIGNTREEIAQQVEVLSSYGPKVIAVDAYFLQPKDPVGDSTLFAVFSHIPNLVVGAVATNESENADAKDHEEGNLKLLTSFAPLDKTGHTGYVNFVGEENKTIRLFKPQLEIEGKQVNSFATEVVRLADKDKYDRLLARKKKVEHINYSRSPQQYIPVLNPGEIVAGNPALNMLKGKIVLVGATNFTDLSDLHFTPMNARIAGRSKPDMPGVFIHANTIQMILDENYVNVIPDWVVFLFSVLLTYVSIVFYTRYYVEKHIWYHLMAKIVQFVFTVFFILLEIMLLSKANIRFSDKIILVPIILSVDLLYFYDALVKYLHKRFGYQTYFLKGHN